jgi:hypothetical protein
MTKKEIKALKEFIARMKVSTRLPYSSDPDFDAGIDYGREDAGEQLESLLRNDLKIDLGE